MEAAKTFLSSGQRERALLVVRRRAGTRALLARTHAWLYNVEEALMSLDSAQRTATLFTSLRAGADVLKALTASMPLLEAEAAMDDTAEAAESIRRLNTVLAGAEVGRGEGVEEAEAELREMEKEAARAAGAGAARVTGGAAGARADVAAAAVSPEVAAEAAADGEALPAVPTQPPRLPAGAGGVSVPAPAAAAAAAARRGRAEGAACVAEPA